MDTAAILNPSPFWVTPTIVNTCQTIPTCQILSEELRFGTGISCFLVATHDILKLAQDML